MFKHMFERPRSIVGWLAFPLAWAITLFFQLLVRLLSAVIESFSSVFGDMFDSLRRPR